MKFEELDLREIAVSLRSGDIRWSLRLQCVRALEPLFDAACEQEERGTSDSVFPYFGQVWSSGFALTQYLLSIAPDGRAIYEQYPGPVWELGCGLALPSLALARMGRDVLALDAHHLVPDFLAVNRALNGLQQNPRYQHLNWDEPNMLVAEQSVRPSVVLASDVLYEARQVNALAGVLDRICTPQTTVFLTDPGRPYLEDFVQAMKARAFECRLEVLELSVSSKDVADGANEVFLLQFRRRAHA